MTSVFNMKIGAHVSIAGGIEKAPQRAADLGCECFQIFSRSPQGGKVKEITDQTAAEFLKECKKYNFNPKDCIIHTPYFINLASTNNRIFYGSVSVIKKELETAERLGIPFVVTHLGSAKDLNDPKEVQEKVVKGLNKIFEKHKGKTKLLLENSAGSGQIIGKEIKELDFFCKVSYSIELCFDTCHAFAAGQDLNKSLKEINLKKLRFIHLNDSMTDFGSNVDRHEHLSKGKIGVAVLKNVIKVAQKNDINVIIETKHDSVTQDIEWAKVQRNAIDQNN